MDLWAKKILNCLTSEHYFCRQISNPVTLFEESKLDESVEQQISDKAVYFFSMINKFFCFLLSSKTVVKQNKLLQQPTVVEHLSCEHSAQK